MLLLLIFKSNENSIQYLRPNFFEAAGEDSMGSHLYCLQNLQSNKVVQQTLVVSEKAKLESSMKRRQLDDGVFWVWIEKMINLLEPIVDLITATESNELQIHRIVRKLDDLEKIMVLNIIYVKYAEMAGQNN